MTRLTQPPPPYVCSKTVSAGALQHYAMNGKPEGSPPTHQPQQPTPPPRGPPSQPMGGMGGGDLRGGGDLGRDMPDRGQRAPQPPQRGPVGGGGPAQRQMSMPTPDQMMQSRPAPAPDRPMQNRPPAPDRYSIQHRTRGKIGVWCCYVTEG